MSDDTQPKRYTRARYATNEEFEAAWERLMGTRYGDGPAQQGQTVYTSNPFTYLLILLLARFQGDAMPQEREIKFIHEHMIEIFGSTHSALHIAEVELMAHGMLRSIKEGVKSAWPEGMR